MLPACSRLFAIGRVRIIDTLHVKETHEKCLKVNERVILKIARLRNTNPLQPQSLLIKSSGTILMPLKMSGLSKMDTEAKRCFATHDEDNDYFNMRIYIILIACVYIQQFNFIQ